MVSSAITISESKPGEREARPGTEDDDADGKTTTAR